jgi:hypothetical protein
LWKFYLKNGDPDNQNALYYIQNMGNGKFIRAVDEGDHASVIVDTDESDLDYFPNMISLLPFASEMDGVDVFFLQTGIRHIGNIIFPGGVRQSSLARCYAKTVGYAAELLCNAA